MGVEVVVRRLVVDGVPAKIGKFVRFDPDEVAMWIDDQRIAAIRTRVEVAAGRSHGQTGTAAIRECAKTAIGTVAGALSARRRPAAEGTPNVRRNPATLWLDQGSGRVARGPGTTAHESYAREWLRELAGISERTREIYTHQIEEHILPRIDEDVPALGRPAIEHAHVRAHPQVVLGARSRTARHRSPPRRTSGCARS
jgi:hypothetical protein